MRQIRMEEDENTKSLLNNKMKDLDKKKMRDRRERTKTRK